MFDLQTRNELKKGNPCAFKEVFRLLFPRLRGYCRLFIHEETLVEDIIQESFLTLWEKRIKINPEQSVESLLFVMVRNRCLNELKKAKIEKGSLKPENIEVTELQYLYQLDFTRKEEKSLEEMLIESMNKAIDELPGKMKKVFLKNKIEGRKQSEIAEELGISLKMVEKHIASAKEKIREKLLKQYPSLIAIITILID